MILYCDTSALIKLYVEELESEYMQRYVADVKCLAVSRIAWAEAFATFARRLREAPDDELSLKQAKLALRQNWQDYFVLDVSQAIVEQAGMFAEDFGLRGYDSVQLATALTLQQALGQKIAFACFDKRLNQAAGNLGMSVIF